MVYVAVNHEAWLYGEIDDLLQSLVVFELLFIQSFYKLSKMATVIERIVHISYDIMQWLFVFQSQIVFQKTVQRHENFLDFHETKS